MNKLIAIIALVFASASVASAQDLDLLNPVTGSKGFLRAGYYLNSASWDMKENDNQIWAQISDIQNIGYTELNEEFEIYKFFYIGADFKSYVSKATKGWTFTPLYIDYSIDMGVKLGAFKIGFEHTCTHPVNTLAGVQDPLLSTQSFHDQAYVQLNWTSK